MTDATRKIAQRILADHGQRRPTSHLPTIDDLAALAREYLALVGPDARGPRETLGDTGPTETLYVTVSAAREYAAAARLRDPEFARRELTELLIDARQSSTDESLWRARSTASGLDISARVIVEGRLLVVTTVSVRDYRTGGGRG